ncbi:MAG: glutamate/tyrosine decarboxylase-like PLP-dependent enzyme [Congregibacter sp.]
MCLEQKYLYLLQRSYKPHNECKTSGAKMNKLQDELFEQQGSKKLLSQAQQGAFEYIDNISKQRVFPNEKNLEKLTVFDEPLPEATSDPALLLELLNTVGSVNTVAQTGGRYFGFVNGNALPVTLATKWLSDVWDQNAALYVMSPIASKLESVCQSWLNQLFGLPKQTVAGFVSGTSIATLSGLAAARFRQLQKLGWDVNQQGLFGAPKIRLILGKQTHGTVAKSISLLGFGQASIEWVDCDNQGRIIVEKLPELDQSCILVLQAGNVNSGAFDDFTKLCQLANKAQTWVHIDGAFGLWAKASNMFDEQTMGMDLADSWSVDAHKTLNTPYDCGIVLCKDTEALTSALHQQGSYIQLSEQRDGLLYTPEMSKRARAIELWAAMKYLGRNGIAELVEQLHNHARFFARLLTDNSFTILNEVVFNQVIISCETEQLTQKTLSFVQQSGECWCGGSTWDKKSVIRISLCSWATTEQDIRRSVDVFIKARSQSLKT